VGGRPTIALQITANQVADPVSATPEKLRRPKMFDLTDKLRGPVCTTSCGKWFDYRKINQQAQLLSKTAGRCVACDDNFIADRQVSFDSDFFSRYHLLNLSVL